MPRRAPTPCCAPGCQALAEGRYCADHRNLDRKRVDAQRGTRTQRGYSNRWLRYRAHFLRAHPLCVRCQALGRIKTATVVDHILPHRGDRALFWDKANHQPLCKSCHDRKTALEDGGFGRSGGEG